MTARTRVFAAILGSVWLSYAAGGLVGAAGASGAQAGNAGVVKSLAGVWRAPDYRMKRTSEVGERIFGPNAFDVRTVELTLQPSGEGLLKISTEVVDAKGRKFAPMITEVKLLVAPPQGAASSTPGKIEPAVTVTSAEEQYLDETKYRSPVSGVRVALMTDAAAKEVELRFETPNGTGSFWTTLRPAAPAKPAASAKPVAPAKPAAPATK